MNALDLLLVVHGPDMCELPHATGRHSSDMENDIEAAAWRRSGKLMRRGAPTWFMRVTMELRL